jgi:hypothetical protein
MALAPRASSISPLRAMALGVIAGLYARGLGLEYRATWESTFLEPPTVRAMLATFFAPGAFVTGIAIPDVARIAAIRWPASENAATWLHLMAATLAVVVIGPRLLLALSMSAIERYRRAHLVDDLADPYFQRMLRGFTQGPMSVTVRPLQLFAGRGFREALQSLLARALGDRVAVDWHPRLRTATRTPLPWPARRGRAPSSRCSTRPQHPSARRMDGSSRCSAGAGRP